MFWLWLTLVTLCRCADLWTTYLCSPDLKRELNPLWRWLGWRWTIAVNVVLCPVAAWVYPTKYGTVFYWSVCGWSLLAAALNWLGWVLTLDKNPDLNPEQTLDDD
jgi:hypothetical protein